MTQTLAQVKNLSKKFCRRPRRSRAYALYDILRELGNLSRHVQLRTGEFWALHDVEFEIKRAEVLGVVGQNGAGKSTLINLLSGALKPTTGSIKYRTDRIVVFDHLSSLSPTKTGRENIIEQLCAHGMTNRQARANLSEVVDFAELEGVLDSPVGTYSLGMRQRLGFGIYTRLNPDIFIVDEALNGGDVRFRQRFQSFLDQFVARGGSIVLASHELMTVQAWSTRCILLDQGKILGEGKPEEVIKQYIDLQSRADLFLTGSMQKQNHQLVPEIEREPVRIHSISVVGEGGKKLETKRPFTITIEIDSDIAVEGAICGFEVGSEDKFPIAAMSFGYSPDELHLRIGRNKISFSSSFCTFLPGLYKIAVGVVKRSDGSLLAKKGYDLPSLFTVQSPTDAEINMSLYRHAVTYLDGNWSAPTCEQVLEVQSFAPDFNAPYTAPQSFVSR